MLETGTHDRCPVCLEPYSNLSCRHEVVSWKARSRGGYVCAYTIFAIVLFACSIEAWWALIGPYRHLSRRIEVVVFVGFVGIGIFAVGTAAVVARVCIVSGPGVLARSMLVRQRRVRIIDASRGAR
jgi:hypothetical protein